MHEEYIARVFNECGVAALLGIEVIEVGEGSARGSSPSGRNITTCLEMYTEGSSSPSWTI